MNSHSPRFRSLPVLIGLLLIACLVLAALSARSAWARNRAALALNRALAAGDDFSPVTADSSDSPATPDGMTTVVSFAYRDAGHRALAAGDRAAAGRAFAAAGWDGQTLAAMAEHFFQTDPSRAIAWLALASTDSPDDPQITARLGEACRNNWGQDVACHRFLELNGGNHFTNPDLSAGLNGWSEIGASAIYAALPCPERPAATCAQISMDDPPGDSAPGLSQCFQVVAGVTYRFSAWLKVSAEPETLWRPLYFQGVIDGEARGNWTGDELGSTDWAYWEREFRAPVYDDGQACFSPVRLLGAGQAWFYAGQVIALTDGP
jgi:hypothetical protein